MKSSNPLYMPRSYSDLFSDFPDFQRSKRCDLKTSYKTFWGLLHALLYSFSHKFHKTAGNCTSPTEKSNYAH